MGEHREGIAQPRALQAMLEMGRLCIQCSRVPSAKTSLQRIWMCFGHPSSRGHRSVSRTLFVGRAAHNSATCAGSHVSGCASGAQRSGARVEGGDAAPDSRRVARHGADEAQRREAGRALHTAPSECDRGPESGGSRMWPRTQGGCCSRCASHFTDACHGSGGACVARRLRRARGESSASSPPLAPVSCSADALRIPAWAQGGLCWCGRAEGRGRRL